MDLNFMETYIHNIVTRTHLRKHVHHIDSYKHIFIA